MQFIIHFCSAAAPTSYIHYSLYAEQLAQAACEHVVRFDGRHHILQVAVALADALQEGKGQEEEAGPEQVAQRRQVGNGRVVGIDLPLPHRMDHDVRRVEEQRDLQQTHGRVGEHKGGPQRRLAHVNVVGAEDEQDLAGYGHEDENSRGLCVGNG